MSNWRDTLRRGRRIVHEKMSFPANLLLKAGGTPHPVTVRGPHYGKPDTVGGLAGENGWAERVETPPRLLFWVEELPFKLSRGCLVAVSATEAYEIKVVEDPEGQTVYAQVDKLSNDRAAALPFPQNV